MDRIVSTVCFEGSVYIFTAFGKIYEMHRDAVTGKVQFQRVAKIELP